MTLAQVIWSANALTSIELCIAIESFDQPAPLLLESEHPPETLTTNSVSLSLKSLPADGSVNPVTLTEQSRDKAAPQGPLIPQPGQGDHEGDTRACLDPESLRRRSQGANGELSGSAVDAARRAGYPWTEQMSRKLSRKVRETRSSSSQKRSERALPSSPGPCGPRPAERRSEVLR